MKTRKYSLFLGLALLALVLTLFSCGKGATENKLLGRWCRINLDNLDDSLRIEEWEFTGEDLVIHHHHAYDPADTAALSGMYVMNSYREFTVSGSVEDGWNADANGTWRIVKLKKGSLIIIRDEGGHGLTFKEFKKL